MSQLDKPGEWATGGDAPTAKQTSFISTLASQKGVDPPSPTTLNKSQASQKINELKNLPTSSSPTTPSGGETSKADEPLQDPSTWSTGADAATDKQMGYIAVMAKEAGEEGPPQGRGQMGKSEASERIGELKERTGM